jgi:hypothetical protein
MEVLKHAGKRMSIYRQIWVEKYGLSKILTSILDRSIIIASTKLVRAGARQVRRTSETAVDKPEAPQGIPWKTLPHLLLKLKINSDGPYHRGVYQTFIFASYLNLPRFVAEA